MPSHLQRQVLGAFRPASVLQKACLGRRTWAIAFAIGLFFNYSPVLLGQNNDSVKPPGSDIRVQPETAPGLTSNSEGARRSNGTERSHQPAALGVLIDAMDDAVDVVEVVGGSPADRAGISVGDEIRYVGDVRIRTTQGLIDSICQAAPGTRVELTIRRNGRRQIVEAELSTWQAVFGNRIQSPADESSGANAGSTQGRDRAPSSNAYRSYSYGPRSGRSASSAQQEPRRVQTRREINSSACPAAPAGTFDFNTWLQRQRHGEGNSDPALFQ